MRPTVEEIKLYCRIDNSIEDDMLEALESSMFRLITTYLNRDVITDDSELTGNAIYYNDGIRIAEMMLIDWNYNNRSSVGNTPLEIPGAAKMILDLYRVSNV